MDSKQAEKMSCFVALRACTLRVTLVVVIGLGLFVSALVVCSEVYGQKIIVNTEGDAVISPVSTRYCKGVQISVADNKSHFISHVMPRKPSISAKKLTYTSGRKFYIPSWSFQYWGVYLLKESSIDLYICPDQYLMFYVVKGLKSFSEWKQSTLFRGYKQIHRLFPKKDCDKRSQYDHFKLKAEENDFFYIMVSSSVGWRFYTSVSLSLTFSRNIYNTSTALFSCSSEASNGTCYLPLEYSSDNVVVLEHAPRFGETPDFFQKSRIKWKPEPRSTYYLKFFGGMFLCVVSLTLLYSLVRCATKVYQTPDKFPILKPGKVDSRTTFRKYPYPRKITRTSITSYDVVNQSELIDEEEDNERRLSILNEEFLASTTYTSTDQVRDLSMTAAGISAI